MSVPSRFEDQSIAEQIRLLEVIAHEGLNSFHCHLDRLDHCKEVHNELNEKQGCPAVEYESVYLTSVQSIEVKAVQLLVVVDRCAQPL